MTTDDQTAALAAHVASQLRKVAEIIERTPERLIQFEYETGHDGTVDLELRLAPPASQENAPSGE